MEDKSQAVKVKLSIVFTRASLSLTNIGRKTKWQLSLRRCGGTLGYSSRYLSARKFQRNDFEPDVKVTLNTAF